LEIGVDQAQKRRVVEGLQRDLTGTACVVVTHQSGLSVAEVTLLRRQVRDAGASFRVTKNRLAKRALTGTPFEPLSPLFTGPTAIAFSSDPVAAAKVVVGYANRNDKLTIIGGGLAGRQMDAAEVRELASLTRRTARQADRAAAGSGGPARAGAAGPRWANCARSGSPCGKRGREQRLADLFSYILGNQE
jgi:large subunit ribosomal protein L10